MTTVRDRAPGPLADLMRRHRIAAGLGQAEVARRSGLSERALRDLERGATRRPRHHSVRAVATALGLTGAELSAFLAAADPDAAARLPAPLPLDPDRLIGRHDELLALTDLATGGRHRLVTVIGPGGVGKTRLAAALAAEVATRAWDIRTADLSGLTDPDLVGDALAEAFDARAGSRVGPVDRLAARLGDRRAVVVVDGFERLVPAAPVVAEMVRRCPGLTVVTTSQRPLRVTGERLLRLPPLPVPAAVALFAARAAAVAEGFVVDDANRAAVIAICRRVEGLPLAVELAAARMAMVSPAELLDRLDRPLNLLTDGGRDRPARHRSLRATITSSLDVVGAGAGAVFAVLGAFAAAAALEDLEGVAARLGHDCLFEALAELVEMSLVRVQAGEDGSRYTLPDPVRHVAAERLAAGPAEGAVRRAVARQYLDRMARIDAGPDADNVRAAVGWAVRAAPELITAADVQALLHYYDRTGRLTEGQAALGRLAGTGPAIAAIHAGNLARLRGDFAEAARFGTVALHRLPADDHRARCLAQLLLGSVATEQRDAAGSRRHLHAALAQARRAGDVGLLGRVLNNLGTRSMELGRLRDAERLLSAALVAKTRAGGNDVELGRTLFNLAETALDAGRLALAAQRADQARDRLTAGGHRRLGAFAASTAALARLHDGDLAGAVAAGRDAVELLGEADDDRRSPTVIGLRLSVVQHAAGDRAGAAAALRRVVPAMLASTARDREELANALDWHADLTARRDPRAAARLLGASERLRRDADRPRSPVARDAARRATKLAHQAGLPHLPHLPHLPLNADHEVSAMVGAIWADKPHDRCEEAAMIDSRTCRRGTLPISVRGSSATAMTRRGAL